jgi:hypothetical protein
VTRFGPNCNATGTLAVLLAKVPPNTLKGLSDGRRRHCEENWLHPAREETDRQSERRRGEESRRMSHSRTTRCPYNGEQIMRGDK